METALLVLGGIIVIGTVVLLVKQYETRMVLIGAGLLMCTLAGDPMQAFAKFSESMTVAMLIRTILSVMGFAYVMKVTQCDAHLIRLLVNSLMRFQSFLIPAAVLVTAFVNISLPSAAGVSAAVGAIVIPLLIHMGVKPAMAATAVMAGTYGSMLSPGWPHNPFVAQLAGTDVSTVIATHGMAVVVSLFIGGASITVLSRFLKEDRGHVPSGHFTLAAMEKPKLLYAILPIVPVFMLMLSSYMSGADAPGWAKSTLEAMPSFKNISVPAAMLIGSIAGIAITRTSPSKCVKEFFNGMGHGYSQVMGIIIAAGVFVGGMHAVGLINVFITALETSDNFAKIAAGIGPFLLAVCTGSGDAATLAFNQAVTPHAVSFGMSIVDMGSLAAIAGSLGRTMSPLAGAAIICAGLARVNPMEIAKRNAPGMVLAIIASLLIF